MYLTLWISCDTGMVSTAKPNVDNRTIHEVRLAHTFASAFLVAQLRAISDAVSAGSPLSNDVIKIMIDIPQY